MKKLLLSTIAAASLVAGSANAGDIYLNVGTNDYDDTVTTGAGAFLGIFAGSGFDAGNSETGSFSEFGFSQLLATSIYDTDGAGNLLGTVTDTNIPAALMAAGIPVGGVTGTALDGSTSVTLERPACDLGQCDIDALSPLVPPAGTDSEGFLRSWDFQVEYSLNAILTPAGPVYTGGTFDFIFNDFFDDSNDRTVITGTVTGSNIQAANLDIFFDVTYAEAGFMFIDNGSSFVDAADRIADGFLPTFTLDTNVNPPIPTADQLLEIGTVAIRQTTLDGSIAASIPEPATVAMLGLGLLGLGASARRKK